MRIIILALELNNELADYQHDIGHSKYILRTYEMKWCRIPPYDERKNVWDHGGNI